jgi:dihydrofolate reductase
MRSISVTMNVSLDGVAQGLGRADEDVRGGFPHGGWGAWHQDEVLSQEMGRDMGRSGDMLFGRRTWEDFAAVWGRRTDGNPFSTHMNAVRKYVASRKLADADAWQNSSVLCGDAARTVAELKTQDGNDLSIIGSVALVRDLHAAGLIDQYTLVIHPITLGSGSRMFDGPAPLTRFTLTRSVTTTKGVVIAYYDKS